MISDFGKDPRLVTPLISGGPNVLPPEVLLLMDGLRALLRCASLHCAAARRGAARCDAAQRSAARRGTES